MCLNINNETYHKLLLHLGQCSLFWVEKNILGRRLLKMLRNCFILPSHKSVRWVINPTLLPLHSVSNLPGKTPLKFNTIPFLLCKSLFWEKYTVRLTGQGLVHELPELPSFPCDPIPSTDSLPFCFLRSATKGSSSSASTSDLPSFCWVNRIPRKSTSSFP